MRRERQAVFFGVVTSFVFAFGVLLAACGGGSGGTTGVNPNGSPVPGAHEVSLKLRDGRTITCVAWYSYSIACDWPARP